MVARKRKAAAVAEPEAPEEPKTPGAQSASRRRSHRITSSTKSRYFEADSESEEEVQRSAKKSRRPNSAGKKAKRAKVESDDDEDIYQEEQVDEDEDDDDEAEAKAEQNGHADDGDEEVDEDAPPKVTFIPIPKLRDTGGVGYVDDKLHKNTLAFLKDLRANNKRTWLKLHDGEYRRSLKDWETYVTTLTEKIVELDGTIPELPFKDVNFRIYRDIRFSNDPTPYKPHYAAAFSRTGRKGPYACYYVHVEPGKCFIGGGLWHPDGDAVQRLRASIDERPQRWRRVLTDPAFQRTFLPESLSKGKGKGKENGKDKEAAAVKAFAAANAENALKTKPKGFIADHRDIELLKLRNYTVSKKVDDAMFTREGGQDEVAATIGAMVGFVTHLNRIVRPDPGDDDEDSENGDGDDDVEE